MISIVLDLVSREGGLWALIAIAFLLLNLKGLPFAWHVSNLLSRVGEIFIS